MSKIGKWLDERLFNNRYDLPNINELDEIICRYYKCGVSRTYKDMTPDEIWETMYDFVGVPYGDVETAGKEFDCMFDKMNTSTYAHEYIKNKMENEKA